MGFIEVAVLLVAVAFCALVAFLVPALIEIKRTVAESQQLLAKMNQDLPSLLREIRETTSNLNAVAETARDGVEHAAVLLHAVGEVGETVQEVHDTVRGQSGRMLANLASVVAGFRAASAVVQERMQQGRADGDERDVEVATQEGGRRNGT